MRPSPLHTLLMLGLIVGSVRISSTLAGSGETPRAPQAAPVVDRTAWYEDAYGATTEDAEEIALKKAQDAVTVYLARHYGNLGWTPSLDYLKQTKLVRLEGSPETVPLDGHQVQHVRVRVELTPPYLQEMQKLARVHRMEHRHLTLGRLLAGLVVLLLVMAGYLRLEEATRGYYTRLLRFGAVAVVLLAGAGLWLMT